MKFEYEARIRAVNAFRKPKRARNALCARAVRSELITCGIAAICSVLITCFVPY